MNRWLLLTLLALIWAPSFLLIKIGLDDISPLTLAAARLAIAAVMLWLLLAARGGSLPRQWAHWKKFLMMGLFSNAIPFAAIALGETRATSAMAAIFNGFTPIATAVLAHLLIAEERMTTWKLIGVLTGFGGIVTIFLPRLDEGLGVESSVWGLIAFAVAAVCYGISIVYARKNLRGYPSLVAPTAQVICGSAMLIPVALLAEWPVSRVPGTPAILSVLYLGIFGTAIAYMIYYRLLEKSNATFVSIVTYLLPPSGIALGAIILDETIGWNAIAGCSMILVGVMLMNVRSRAGG